MLENLALAAGLKIFVCAEAGSAEITAKKVSSANVLDRRIDFIAAHLNCDWKGLMLSWSFSFSNPVSITYFGECGCESVGF